MKKMMSLILAMLMLLTSFAALAEDSVGVIGGADGPTSVFVASGPKTLDQMAREALDAGRRVTTKVRITELAGVETSDPVADAAMLELLGAMELTGAQQGDEIDLALSLGENEVLDLGAAISGEDVYLESKLLGGTIVVNIDEVEPLAQRLLDMLVLMEAMTAEEAAALRQQIAELAEMLKTIEMEAAAMEVPATFDLESMAAWNYTALEQFAALAESKVVPVEEPVVPRMCDPAVSGVKAVFVNEDLVAGAKAILQFLLDNPELMESLGAAAGYPTEEELTQDWESMGQFYVLLGFYEDEAAFRAAQPTFKAEIENKLAELDDVKAIEGEFVTHVYYDAEGEIVYLTSTLPIAELQETVVEGVVQSETKVYPISVAYTRQTVPQGVAHVCNLFVDEGTVTIDSLVSEESTSFAVTIAEPDAEPAKLLDVSVKTGASQTNPGVTCIDVAAHLYDGSDAVVLQVLYDGEYEYSDIRNYLSGDLKLTTFEYQLPTEPVVMSVVDDESGETVEVEAERVVTEMGAELVAIPNTLSLTFSSDLAINGVDFSGKTTVAMAVEQIRIAVEAEYATSDAEPSIMAGAVVRPAELDDQAFSDWFVSLIKNFNLWISNLINALPENVLLWMIYSGMA